MKKENLTRQKNPTTLEEVMPNPPKNGVKLWYDQYREESINAFVPKRYQKVIQELPDLLIENDYAISQNYFLYGDVGFGKSTKALLILMAHLKYLYLRWFKLPYKKINEYEAKYNLSGFMFSAEDIITQDKSFYNTNSSQYEFRKCLETKSVLIIDEIFQAEYTAKDYNVLYNIIEHRLNDMLPTIITCNYSIVELAKLNWIEERMLRRLSEYFTQIKINKK